MHLPIFWSQTAAVELCRKIEAICPEAGCHVALTGGCLYKQDFRKDLDLLFYRIRQVKKIDMEKLWSKLRGVGIEKTSGFGWCYKCKYYDERPIDCFFPEEQGGSQEYLLKP